MKWVLLIGSAWLLVAVVVALVIGRLIRMADERERRDRDGWVRTEVCQGNHVVDSEPNLPRPSPGNRPAAPPCAGRPLDQAHDIPTGRDYGAA